VFSREWANVILKLGIRECRNIGRDQASRRQLIAYFLRLLKEEGFWWQYDRLRNQRNLAFKLGLLQVSKRPDSSDSEEEEASL